MNKTSDHKVKRWPDSQRERLRKINQKQTVYYIPGIHQKYLQYTCCHGEQHQPLKEVNIVLPVLSRQEEKRQKDSLDNTQQNKNSKEIDMIWHQAEYDSMEQMVIASRQIQ
jgi:hypothetical protein